MRSLDSLAHTKVSQLYTQSLRGDGVGLVNVIIFLAARQTQALLFHDQLPVGWGEVIKFMFLCTHRRSNLIILLAVQQTQALHIHDQLPVRWGGVG